MQRLMLKSKLHRATITDANLEYEGSFTIDEDLMRAADILPHEQIRVYNLNNGTRFETYAIPGPPGRGDFCLNGAAARLGAKGDRVIIATYAHYDEKELAHYRPSVILLDSRNKPYSKENHVSDTAA